MLLSNLSKVININRTYNFKKNKSFKEITANSKLTNKNTIYIFDKNSKANISFIKEAIKNNVPAIISNRYYKFISIPQFLVSDIYQETNLLLKKIHKNYPKKTIAITGTNGKTSVTWYISKILNFLKFENTTLGTIGYYKNGKKIDVPILTTPAYEEFFKYASSNKRKNKSIFIFEASSHALDQNRFRNYPINIAAITNITRDHLDYHKSSSAYVKSKLKLFNKYLLKDGHAIINSRIKNLSNIKKKLLQKKVKVTYFGKKNIFFEKQKKVIILNINNKKYNIKNFKLNSDIELENLECAISCCLALKINVKNIIKALSQVTNPPGRIQKINYKKKKSTIIIDFAHTPDALERILKTFEFDGKKPVLLFGCGGNRDKNKRRSMGILANKFASRVYITDDNPRNENPTVIRKNILKYCHKAYEIPSRREAIKKAIKDLQFREVLIIAGKGHENVQIIKNKKYNFDDMKIVKSLIK